MMFISHGSSKNVSNKSDIMTIFFKVRKSLGLGRYKMANLLGMDMTGYIRRESVNKKASYNDLKQLFKVSGWTAERFLKEL